MQPYFFPYIGYFQLIASVDVFVVYDNIKYTKKGWINRNRLLRNGQDVTFSLPLRHASDKLDVCEREVSADFDPRSLLNQIRGSYDKAPHFKPTYAFIEGILSYSGRNLFAYLFNALTRTCQHLAIETEMRVSSSITIDHSLKGQDKVLAICGALGADTYINAIGGTALYEKEAFRARGVTLKFLQARPIAYRQFNDDFVPWLSIIDVMMFNSLESVQGMVRAEFDLV